LLRAIQESEGESIVSTTANSEDTILAKPGMDGRAKSDVFALSRSASLGKTLAAVEQKKRAEIAEAERLAQLKALLSSQADQD
jgi:hypothetical protein